MPALLDRGHRVRCVVRDPRKLDPAPWCGQVDVVQADISEDLSAAMAGIDVAVFLVHSIGEGKDWVARERAIAENFDEPQKLPAFVGSSTSAGSETTTANSACTCAAATTSAKSSPRVRSK